MKALLLISVLWIMPAFALMQGKPISSDEMRDVVAGYYKTYGYETYHSPEYVTTLASPFYWENEDGRFYFIRTPEDISLKADVRPIVEHNGEIKESIESDEFINLMYPDSMFVVNFKGLPPMICYVYNIIRNRQYCGSICYRIGVEKRGGLVKRKIEGGVRRILENPAFVSLEIIPLHGYTGEDLKPKINRFNSDGRRKEAVMTDKKKAERMAQRFYARELYRITSANSN